MKQLMMLASSLALVLSASSVMAGAEAMQAAGKKVFNHHCDACHSDDSSKNTFGPNLVGVYGRKAGSLPRFAYSDAMKKSGLTWDEANLRKWIADNEALVPGTRMRHVAIQDRAEQDYLIAFLKSMK